MQQSMAEVNETEKD